MKQLLLLFATSRQTFACSHCQAPEVIPQRPQESPEQAPAMAFRPAAKTEAWGVAERRGAVEDLVLLEDLMLVGNGSRGHDVGFVCNGSVPKSILRPRFCCTPTPASSAFKRPAPDVQLTCIWVARKSSPCTRKVANSQCRTGSLECQRLAKVRVGETAGPENWLHPHHLHGSPPGLEQFNPR